MAEFLSLKYGRKIDFKGLKRAEFAIRAIRWSQIAIRA
jgi:hypothetical protein